MTTKHRWECDSCGRTEKVREGRAMSEGWQYLFGEPVRHACSRRCARALLIADVETTLDRWYRFPEENAA